MLKISTFSLVLMSVMALFFSSSVFAQLTMPQPSPSAMVKQTVGLTDITIDYSSPAMRQREVWGGLVPYGEIWRTGANKATNITFSDEVSIKGTKIPAGTYALFTIPNEKEWTVIINKNSEQWGAGQYDEKEDVVRFMVTPMISPIIHERMMFTIEAMEDKQGEVSLWWSNTRISFVVDADPVATMISNIENTLEKANNIWYTYAQSAEYYMDNKQDTNKAMEWINKSISLKDHYYNNWIKARLMMTGNKTGGVSSNTQGAIDLAKKAMEMGEKENTNFYKRLKPEMEQFIKTYSQQLPKNVDTKKK
ncbi:DUF2911 domain-containing protein [Bernardetia sp. ABR2-2B]|uniref:DUF2911 domain-containing protein n=1 Tax=Bernardetia sp. ABR2-2B TaxID=3127472 RepID=UPI0030D43E92